MDTQQLSFKAEMLQIELRMQAIIVENKQREQRGESVVNEFDCLEYDLQELIIRMRNY